jgi:hypothetical protein
VYGFVRSIMMRGGGWCGSSAVGSGSVVTWRRAQMVLLSAQGMDVAGIAKVALTSQDRDVGPKRTSITSRTVTLSDVATTTTSGDDEQEHAEQQQEHTKQREAVRKLKTAVELAESKLDETRANWRRRTSFGRLAEDDRRLLFVTFIGALAANVGLVLIVGLGVVVARVLHRYPLGLLYLGIMTLTMIFLLLAVPTLRLGSLLCLVLLTTILVLGLVGYAAGIH